MSISSAQCRRTAVQGPARHPHAMAVENSSAGCTCPEKTGSLESVCCTCATRGCQCPSETHARLVGLIQHVVSCLGQPTRCGGRTRTFPSCLGTMPAKAPSQSAFCVTAGMSVLRLHPVCVLELRPGSFAAFDRALLRVRRIVRDRQAGTGGCSPHTRLDRERTRLCHGRMNAWSFSRSSGARA